MSPMTSKRLKRFSKIDFFRKREIVDKLFFLMLSDMWEKCKFAVEFFLFHLKDIVDEHSDN